MKLTDINIRDPFVLLDNGKYYMYGTRGAECWGRGTGFDVYESEDLENWSEPICVFAKTDSFWADRNFWAPEVHKYNGAYYMFASFKSETKCRGVQILKADSPLGPFAIHSDGPVTPIDWECLDGTLYVENGKPYMIFCHEWKQVTDGEMCVAELSEDLTKMVSEPKLMFRASQPSFSKAINDKGAYVTDGPYMYKTESGRLIMIWSSFSDGGYCEALAYSKDGSVLGEWEHDDRTLFEKDGGHGMIFRDKAGKIRFILHKPNTSTLERPNLFELCEAEDSLFVK